MNNTCGDRDCFVCYPDDPSILAENKRLREALERIRNQSFGQVCKTYEICHHRACHASYAAWAISDEALKKISA